MYMYKLYCSYVSKTHWFCDIEMEHITSVCVHVCVLNGYSKLIWPLKKEKKVVNI